MAARGPDRGTGDRSRRAAPARTSSPRRLRQAGLACVLAGGILIAAFAAGSVRGVHESRAVTEAWHRQLAADPPPGLPETPPAAGLLQAVDGVDFAIRVPRLDYYAAVREGVDKGVLYSGPGHYPDTPWPGQPGMVAVAAHNINWIDFPGLARGDEIDLETRYGTFRYRVTGTRIVEPNDMTVIVQGPGRHLILTTCWPIWAGALATQRFIIFTEQTEPASAPEPPAREGNGERHRPGGQIDGAS